MRFALSLGGIVLLPLMALGSAPVASAAGLDLADYLEQPGVYVVLRWTEEGGFNSLADYETRWLAAFSQRQFGEELALVREQYVAYPGSLVFDDLIGNDPVVAAGVFTEAYLSGKTLYTVWFGQGFDSAGNPLPGSLPVVQELRFEPDGTLIATGLLNQSDGTSTWAVDATGLLYFGGDAANGNRIACDHSEDYIRTYFVEGREFDNVDLFFFDRDAALDFAATLTDSIPPCSVPAVATVIPDAAGGE
jgi:hypothetical protein